jgi:hypothetical protein
MIGVQQQVNILIGTIEVGKKRGLIERYLKEYTKRLVDRSV